jgi:hypothetical protein
MNEVDPNDEKTIATTFNKLVKIVDDERRIFSKLLLTIYTPVTSGLFFISNSIILEDNCKKYFFLVITITSTMIVFSALLENLGYFLISREMTDVYTKHVRETGKHLVGPFSGKSWQSNFIEMQIYIMTFLLMVNLLSVIAFISLRVF